MIAANSRLSWFILAIFLGVSVLSYGQIKSGAYRLMLKGLLSHSVPEIGVGEAARDSAAIVFLDSRAHREFEVSHIRNAIYIGYDSFDIKKVSTIPKDSRIVIYCSVGYRSEKISEQLLAAGYSSVSNLYGGIFEWVNQGYPVCNNEGATKNVHAFDRVWGVWLKRGKKVYE